MSRKSSFISSLLPMMPIKNGLASSISRRQVSMTLPSLAASSVMPHRRSRGTNSTLRFSHASLMRGKMRVSASRSAFMSTKVEEMKSRSCLCVCAKVSVCVLVLGVIVVYYFRSLNHSVNFVVVLLVMVFTDTRSSGVPMM